jgi:hypothetical protein
MLGKKIRPLSNHASLGLISYCSSSSYQFLCIESFSPTFSHVTMSVSKLLSRIVRPESHINPDQENKEDKVSLDASQLHDHTFGITSCPLTHFACVLSALIHDVDHPGVPNMTLVKEKDPMAARFSNKSIAEQNSVDLALAMLMKPEYKDLRGCIYTTNDEFQLFRSSIITIVLATDIMDKDLGALRKARWEKVFLKGSRDDASAKKDIKEDINRKATIVLEHLIQASDVAHTMQHW